LHVQIYCKQLFNIKSKYRTQYSIQLIVNQACCIKAQTDFIPPSLWPLNTHDLNPVDRGVGILQDRVYRDQIKDVEELRQHV